MRKPSLFIAAVLVLVTGMVYLQTLSFSFVGFDDPELILDNPRVRPGLAKEGLIWAFGASWRENVFFYPLSLVTHMIDCTLFGLHAGGHHFSSLLYHAGAGVLLFFLLSALSGAPWRSGLVAGLFAVHPLGADSVAWVAERSNVLCGLLWMATLIAYVRFCRGAGGRRRAWYLASLLFFCLALLAKPTAVTLPVVMLLMDWLMLGRFNKEGSGPGASAPRTVLAEKVPFFLLAAARASAGIAVPVATDAAVSTVARPLMLRLANGLAAVPVYMRRLFAPVDLSVYYPFPQAIAWWKPLAALFLISTITAVLFFLRRQKPLALFGWSWFVVALAPAMGLVQSGPWPAMADHYVYIPMIGLLIALAWAVPEKWTTPGTRPARLTTAASVLVLIATGIAGFWQARHYRDSVTLFERAVKVTDKNFFALTGLGNAYAERGEQGKAESAFRAALDLEPGSPGAHTNLGRVLAARGDTRSAMAHFAAALAADGRFAPAHVNLGNLLLQARRPEAAVSHYRQALDADPGLVSAHNNLALALASAGRMQEALEHLQKAVARFPRSLELRQTLARLRDRAAAGEYGQ